ncbi:DNA-binding protein [Nostoc sp. CHAB 5844]|nr:DNA-binding protein [Nostoc sp. CHAB 5844]
MQSVAYSLSWVKTACEHILGKTISPRAWRNYLRICGIERYQRQVKLKECCYLLGLTYLKRQNPFKKYFLSDVSLLLIKEQQRLTKFGIDLENPDLPLLGRDLPNYIYEQTGHKVTLRTLYRWSSKHRIPFSKLRTINQQELHKWLEIGMNAA